MDELISIQEAENRIARSCHGLGKERIDLHAAIGRVLAEALVADRPLPPFPRAMMDGVAFRAAEIFPSVPLKIAGLHAAGDPPPRALATGEAWEIMTGAAVPEDCDTVVPYEDLTEAMALSEKPEPGQFIHACGNDAAAGQVLVKAGCRISAAEIAIAASVGKSQLEVYRLPKIAIITTGDEAIPVNQTPEPWQIRRSNGPMLDAALTRLGNPASFIAHVNDDPKEAAEVIGHALETCDVLILCGGISKGKKDYVRALIEEKLGAPEFHGVKLRPGKPLAYWKGAPQVFALPGNPVSVLATFTRFVIPALLKIQGLETHAPLKISVPNVAPLPQFSWLLPVAPDEHGALIPRPPKNSGDYVSIAGAIGIVEIPPKPDFTSSERFSFYPFP